MTKRKSSLAMRDYPLSTKYGWNFNQQALTFTEYKMTSTLANLVMRDTLQISGSVIFQ